LNRKVAFSRASGVLLHPTSLPGRHGIGDFGPSAFRFVDWLLESGQSLWQVCPLGPTGYGDSPYQCLSAFAGNPLMISLDQLVADGLLLSGELAPAEQTDGPVDYGAVIAHHTPLLERAWQRLLGLTDVRATRFARFVRNAAGWLEDYALFAALKEEAGGAPWYEWESDLRGRDPGTLARARTRLADRMQFHRFVQFTFFDQWAGLRAYARRNGVSIIGDMPIFVAHDSAECWARPELFQFDDDLWPTAVAGVPPDYFSDTGQLWGNPLYRWESHRTEGFRWWIELFRTRFTLFDALRVDHFRGFEAYWRVPWGSRTAENGEWVPAPGKELFDRVFEELGPVPIIAEDLGVITPAVVELMDHCGFPGMKILQFAFDSGDTNEYLPHTFDSHSVVYTGTHDNDTVHGWYAGASPGDREHARAYLNSSGEEIHWDFIRTALASVSRLAVVPMQDVLGLGTDARMNVPGTTGGNWRWRITGDQLADTATVRRLRSLTELYGRLA